MDVEDLRLAVYHTFADGALPDVAGLAAITGSSTDDVIAGLHRLARDRHLVLGPAGDDPDAEVRIVMAHPFSAVPLGFSVMGPRTPVVGGCAWDSFALPHLVPHAPEVLVATTCPACGRPHSWQVTRHEPPLGDQIAHFLVPAADMWRDVVHTCAHQRIFCARPCVDKWAQRAGVRPGYVMDLGTLWRLAAGWYEGRLERGYVRREPATAAAYLRGVGLSGPFWGL